jgi:hypothetical protein
MTAQRDRAVPAAGPRFGRIGWPRSGRRRGRPWLVAVQDAPFGSRVSVVGEHAPIVQLRKLVQMRYPRRLVSCGRGRRWGGGGRSDGRGWLSGYGSTWAGGSQDLLACGVHAELTPEPLGLRHVPGLGEPACAERRGRAGHRTYVRQLGAAELEAPAAYGADQIVVRPVGHNGNEVQAYRLLRPDVVEEYLVMAVRAHARRDLALILRAAWPEAENHHHEVIETAAPRAAVHPLQVIAEAAGTPSRPTAATGEHEAAFIAAQLIPGSAQDRLFAGA